MTIDVAEPIAARKPRTEERLTESNYQYKLPDHWILDPTKIWTLQHGQRTKQVIDLVVSSGAKTVLEVGCGDGYNCGELVKAGLNVAGVDWSENGIAHARRLVPKARFFRGDIRDEGFKQAFPDNFDSLMLIEVLEHIPPADCASALRSMTECLKPGGLFVLTTPSINLRKIPTMHYRHFDEATLRSVIAEAGDLEITSLQGYGDIVSAFRFYRWSRILDNKVFTIKPPIKMWKTHYAKRCINSSPARCEGWIVAMRKQ